ncbi:hypothetical protein P3T39_007492 [Kitasatospora sp. GP82]|nr:hypothetical protein [Kitasatospora sp. GP82]
MASFSWSRPTMDRVRELRLAHLPVDPVSRTVYLLGELA